MTTDAVEGVEPETARGGDRIAERSTCRRAGDVIAAVEEEAERIKRREVDETVRKLEGYDDLTERQREIVETMADAIFDGLLGPPTQRLAAAAVADDPATIEAARQVFALELGPGDPSERANRPGGPEVTSDDD